jgi:hypothetical protein
LGGSAGRAQQAGGGGEGGQKNRAVHGDPIIVSNVGATALPGVGVIFTTWFSQRGFRCVVIATQPALHTP